MRDPKHDLLVSLPAEVVPLTLERLAERSEIKRMEHRAAVISASSTEAEYLAMLMAMYDADRCLAFWPRHRLSDRLHERCDFMLLKKQKLRPLRAEIVNVLRIHLRWSVVLVKRTWNE